MVKERLSDLAVHGTYAKNPRLVPRSARAVHSHRLIAEALETLAAAFIGRMTQMNTDSLKHFHSAP